MPGRFPSSTCPQPHCTKIKSDTHRYTQCRSVSQTWGWLRDILHLMDPVLSLMGASDILHLDFPKGFRENAILQLLRHFVELVENEVVLKNHILDHTSMQGLFRQKKQNAGLMTFPDLGMIPGLDFVREGVG